jgi:hypothetical protein
LRAEAFDAVADPFVVPFIMDQLRQLADGYAALAEDCAARLAKHSSSASDEAG